MPARIVTPTLADAARAMTGSGVTVRAAANRLGVSRATVRRALALAALAVATPAAAAYACHPSTERPAFAAPSDGVLLSTGEQNMTGLVSGWLAAHHAPQLVADDYQLVANAQQVLVVPVRAGFVCPGAAMVSITPDVAVTLFSAMLDRARNRA